MEGRRNIKRERRTGGKKEFRGKGGKGKKKSSAGFKPVRLVLLVFLLSDLSVSSIFGLRFSYMLDTIGCLLCSSDQLDVSLVLRGCRLRSHLSCRHLPDPYLKTTCSHLPPLCCYYQIIFWKNVDTYHVFISEKCKIQLHICLR